LKTNTDISYRLEAAFAKADAPPLADTRSYYLYLPPEQMVIMTN
jgi:hypothetical protein